MNKKQSDTIRANMDRILAPAKKEFAWMLTVPPGEEASPEVDHSQSGPHIDERQQEMRAPAHISFSRLLAETAAERYEKEVGVLESLDRESAQARAQGIIRMLAYTAFQREYLTDTSGERFQHL
jgi:hypothetical protein